MGKKVDEKAHTYEIGPLSIEALAWIFTEWKHEVRYNLRIGSIEVKRTGEIWEQLTDLIRQVYIEKIATTCTAGGKIARFSQDRFHSAVMALAAIRQEDPVRVWLDELPPWDNEIRLPFLLDEFFGAGRDALAQWASIYMMLGPIQRAKKPGCELQQIPVLIGSQNIGKSTFLERILPQEHRGMWLKQGLHIQKDPQRNYEQISRALIVEYAELAGVRHGEVEFLKSFLTTTIDQVRRPYARAPEDFPRRCVFVGTSNDYNCLPNDPTGNRRFVVIPCPRKVIGALPWIEANRNQLWAEAQYRYWSGERAGLDANLSEMQESRNSEYRDADEIEIQIAAVMSGIPGDYTMQEIAEKIGLARIGKYGDPEMIDRRVQTRLSAAMRNFGAVPVKETIEGKQVRLWRFPE